jgi:hypothetical protein
VTVNATAQTDFPGNGVELVGPVTKMQPDITNMKALHETSGINTVCLHAYVTNCGVEPKKI